ncbi:cobalt-precorrin 5A hydrolase / precorrin-3B C17-methyltransferase [Streptoalloteichus tenebrarius]|uniref:Cobalt-precorrin 5A hydrolase / precorrin-3B C17-methyltransferase n=1 Tax=Streptoalloteichus tenebrarius (strain ATCC 17920 / DSM 40477 / JCM 4838 / CBS 697.72 / NBRC 16177 / NCIMB 11028 / NRRL B-12390 / A12253. 1 / ISP 5477) TaxID=1933 RepID=A0ABT1HMW1_STRSD|nr:cobalamin biosynthesis protein [Streptoalloteichus tenebrarius]MCP2256862.1 cobalt-precorrin 5A hydrolase / precorrin-3B C17-methyltransferase [Streptoalloteichus tenebrarius]BFF00231.1 precorrin-3B C(17)-methyltransferase [Streptoalloteichus tenebrarius]
MIGLFAATAAGRRVATELAAHLGPDAVVVDGPVRPALHRMWPRLGAAVVLLGAGATVRLVAPLLSDEQTDPGVVSVDEDGRFVVALAGAHAGGANTLAERVAEILGGTAVPTPGGDATGTSVLDELVELLDAEVDGDLVACGAAVVGGAPVRLVNPLRFPLPALPSNVASDVDSPEWTIMVDDRIPVEPDRAADWPGHPVRPAEGSLLRLVPRTLVVGVGSSTGVATGAVTSALSLVESEHGFDLGAVRAFATIDTKAAERGILEAVEDHGFWNTDTELPLLRYPAAVLSEVDVPNPDEAVRARTGTPSVAEAAALRGAAELAAGGAVELVVDKIRGDAVTVAVARVRPRGRLAVLGLGPGAADLRAPRVEAELRRSAVLLGLDGDVERVRHLLRPGTRVRTGGPGGNEARARQAAELAANGAAVAVVVSGDTSLDELSGPALDQVGADVELVGVPGATDVLAAAALLGAPLDHDHAVISLDDPRVPWEDTERRLRAAAEADLVVCLRHAGDGDGRSRRALEILRERRSPDTPVGVVRAGDLGDRRVWTGTVAEFDLSYVDDGATVFVGASRTALVAGRLVTRHRPRA